ncbi:GtrA family protein [Niallia sp. Sow4_A1]|uniref:GtrA family protein n=1 Tax=unclassified Niallia TaxID=2837522 RepID=UPI003F8A4257
MKDKSFFKFLVVGLMNTFIGLSIIYLCLNAFHFDYWLATFSGNAVGACVSYVLNKRFTFKSNAAFGSSGLRFIVVILASYLLAYKAGLVFVEMLLGEWTIFFSYTDEIAVLFGSGFYTLLNYAGQKYFVFPKRYQQNARSVK